MAPVDALGFAGKERACLGCFVANCNDVIKCLVEIFAQVLRAMGADIDACVLHGFDRQGIHHRWLAPRAEHVVPVACYMPEQTLCHLRASRVTRT